MLSKIGTKKFAFILLFNLKPKYHRRQKICGTSSQSNSWKAKTNVKNVFSMSRFVPKIVDYFVLYNYQGSWPSNKYTHFDLTLFV